MPKYRRFYISHAPIFVTLVTHKRVIWLPKHVEQLLSSMREAKNKYPYKHIAHVIMPDHFHWLFEMHDENNFSKLIAFVKRDMSWRLRDIGIDHLWQKRFYDHVIRDQDDLDRHIDYVHFNPVKHGEVLKVNDYPHSSFAQWQKRGRYDEAWGDIEPENIRALDYE